jgi:hypothetical protein
MNPDSIQIMNHENEKWNNAKVNIICWIIATPIAYIVMNLFFGFFYFKAIPFWLCVIWCIFCMSIDLIIGNKNSRDKFFY